MIDAHQHFWSLERGDYDWLTEDLAPLYRDFGPEDLEPLLREASIDRTVLVQAAPTLEETRFLLDLAVSAPIVAAVVGWVDLGSAEAEHQLDEFQSRGWFRGIRPMIQDIPDDDWMLRPEVAAGLDLLSDRRLRLDALVQPHHLPNLHTLLQRHPYLDVVIDHGAKPDIAKETFEPWATHIARIAGETRACCKVSGLVTQAAPGWTVDTLRPYLDHLFESFGPERLMWGSDWPVVELAGGYGAWRRASLDYLAALSTDERSAVLSGTAARFYDIEEETE